MRAQLAATGLGYRFFEAVDCRSARLAEVSRYDDVLTVRRYGHPLTPGEVGCFASHYLLWKACVASNEAVLVMEDDLLIVDGFADAVRLLDDRRRGINRLHFVRLCVDSERPYRMVARLGDGFSLVRYEKGPRGSQAYALSVYGAQRLLACADTWCRALDMQLDAFWEHGLASWAVLPFPARHLQEAPSTIAEAKVRPKLSLAAKLRREITYAGQDVRRCWFNAQQRLRDRSLAASLAQT